MFAAKSEPFRLIPSQCASPPRKIKLLPLQEGVKAFLIQDGKIIDEIMIDRFNDRTKKSGRPEVKVVSLVFDKGRVATFTFIEYDFPSGWRMMDTDPMLGTSCYSRRGPAYEIRHYPPGDTEVDG